MQQIELNYNPKSDVAGQNCGVCTNFQPSMGSDVDGSCFGHPVTVEGLCNFFNPKNSQVEAHPVGD